MLELIAALALAADGKPELHPRRMAQVDCVAALGLVGNDQARKQKGAARFPKIAGRDQILAGAVARRIMTETGRSDEQVRALYKAAVSQLQEGAVNSPDPKAFVDGRVAPCLPWLKAVDPKAGADGVVAGLDDGIPPIAPPAPEAPAAPGVPAAPAPLTSYDPGALRCAALIGLSLDEVTKREGNSKLAQSFALMLATLEVRAGKGKDRLYAERLETERRFLAAQESRRKTMTAMGIPAESEADGEKRFTDCFALAGR